MINLLGFIGEEVPENERVFRGTIEPVICMDCNHLLEDGICPCCDNEEYEDFPGWDEFFRDDDYFPGYDGDVL